MQLTGAIHRLLRHKSRCVTAQASYKEFSWWATHTCSARHGPLLKRSEECSKSLRTAGTFSRRAQRRSCPVRAGFRPLGRVGALARRKGRMRHDEPPRLADHLDQRRLVHTVTRAERCRHRLVDAPTLVLGRARAEFLHLDKLAHDLGLFFFVSRFDVGWTNSVTFTRDGILHARVTFGVTSHEICVFLI